MRIDRRKFVQSLGAAGALAVSGNAVATAVANAADVPATSPTGLLAMKESEVRRLIGRSFIATSAQGHPVELVLTEVNGLQRKANTKVGYSGECFSAIFKNHQRVTLDQGIYEIRGATSGKFSALLVPTDRHRTDFEIIVNNLKR